MKIVRFAVVLLSIFCSIEGFKVLGVLPFASNSHFMIGHSILKSLVNVGHEVTVISPFPLKKPLKNYHDVDVSTVLEQFKKDQIPNPFLLGDMNLLTLVTFLYKFGDDMVNSYMQHPEVLKLMNSKEKFDVCLLELFNADAFLGIADHFDCTLVTYTTFGAVKWIDDMTSNQSPYSYVPHPYLTFTDKMTFWQRLSNTVHSHLESILYHFRHLPNQKRLYQKYFPNAKKSFEEMYKSSSIIFLNNHVSSSSPRPYLPNMIEIGGIHVVPSKPLPTDIQEFLDSAKDGAILFSMGSIIQATQWPLEKREAFIKSFGKLKHKVLWKYENDTLPNKPDNVMISPWIPQRDILAHPNVKLFITHGGLLGTTEAMVEGVPVLGIPIFGDQKMNMAKAVAREYGLQIYNEDITDETFSNVLTEFFSDPKYANNAKTISERFIDRPMRPQETVVYWTEYALRHKGAHHLKTAGNSLSFFEFHLVDVYLTLIGFAIIVLYLNFLSFRFVLKKIFPPKAQLKTKRN